MPELPEVEVVRQVLEKNLVGLVITDVECFYKPIIEDEFDEFKSLVVNKKITKLERLGKYLIFVLEDGAFISHLRMEGKYFIKPTLDEVVKHEHVIFEFSDGTSLRYADVRKFGTMELKTKDELFTTHPLKELGMEANYLTTSYLKEKIGKKHKDLKAFLLDQSMIAGIGNIYADEICFMAKLHPKQDIYHLTDLDLENICESAKEVINKAIAAGGTTIRSYTSSLGVTGLFQLNLNVHTKVNSPCPMCKNIIIKTRVAGRGTYICTNCQKIK